MSTEKEQEDYNVAIQESLLTAMIHALNDAEATAENASVDEEPSDTKDPGKKLEENHEYLDYTQWIKKGSVFIPTDNSVRVPKIDPGFYNLRVAEKIGFYMFKKDIKLDNLIDLPNKETKEVLDGINNFWQRKDKFKEYGFVYKRGILLYGPPGTGKTSLINLLCFDLVKKMGGVVITMTTRNEMELYSKCIPEIFRLIEPTRPIITIIEDIDSLCDSHSSETELINMLDGIEQLDNVVYIATTNYAEKLSRRIMNRPNRFDRRILVGYPNAEVRRKYIEFKLKPDDLKSINIDYWVEETNGMTLAHIGELIKSVVILGNDEKETLTLLKGFNSTPSSFDYNKPDYEEGIKSPIGFASVQIAQGMFATENSKDKKSKTKY